MKIIIKEDDSIKNINDSQILNCPKYFNYVSLGVCKECDYRLNEKCSSTTFNEKLKIIKKLVS